MSNLLRIGILPILVTLGGFQVGLLLQRKFKTPLLNPTLVSVVTVLLFLMATGMENKDYQASTSAMSWLMTPATICLAIPMYQQFQVLKKSLLPILVGVAAGTVACMASVLGLCLLLRVDSSLTLSLLPKSVTTAIGVALVELAGGLPAVTTAAIIITGIFGNMMGSLFCKLFRITDPVAQGVAWGTASHVIGTTRANEVGQLVGAVSSFSLVVAGLLTAVLFPVFSGLL